MLPCRTQPANETNDKRDSDRLREEEKDEVKLLIEEVHRLKDLEEDVGIPEQDVPKDPVAVDMSIKGRPGTHVTGQASAAMLDQLKQDHCEAKAVKLDNAFVPVKIWDKAVCKGPPSDTELSALATLRSHCLGQYR
jgi:hypothetical protein